MKSLVLFSLLSAVTLTISSQSPSSSSDPSCPAIDDTALMAFSMILHQENNGGTVSDAFFNQLVPYLFGAQSLSCPQKVQLLVSQGLTQAKAARIVTEVMPTLWNNGKSTDETIMSVMIASDDICKAAENSTDCQLKSKALLPMVNIEVEHGCVGSALESSIGSLSPNEMCVCSNQNDVLFWINMFEKITKVNNPAKPNRFPAAMTMILNEQRCEGQLKIGNGPCSCSSINKGNDRLHLTSDEVQSRLTPEEQIAFRDAFGAPTIRQGQPFSTDLNVNDYITSLFGQNINPTLLSLILNQGENSNELIRQLVLSSIGLDSSLLQVILNGGFGDGSDQINFISYLTQLGVLDPSIIPLLFNVDNGADFFITSLIDAQQLDPNAALLLLGQRNGLTNDQILELIIRGANQNNPDFFESLGRPYIPPLPEGVFPGSQLFFAHFETLGVNTCALHDLRNRFQCGYLGITASACEVVPYCCYSPIFMTDQEVRNATNFAITAASAIPWCYYNIFFVYYDSFFLPILRPGEFASPVECVGLFRFGLNINPNIVSIVGTQSSSLSSLLASRTECGFPGITEFQCVAVRGCCYEAQTAFRVPQCYQPNGPTQVDFNYNNLPAAYRPANGSCNVNPFRIPVLYYQRVACHYTIEFHKIGHNLLSFPSRFDCLTKLGCCWEDDETVLERYPFTPQCYQRVGGFRTPSNVPTLQTLFARSGTGGIDKTQFPPASPPEAGK